MLFGRNVASYKFALAKSLLELNEQGQEVVGLADLAEPFSRHICDHLETADRQGSSQSSRFLDSCRAFNRGELTREELLVVTERLGFENVIDAFHVVGKGPVPVRFFEDERRGSTRGIRITDELRELTLTAPAEGLAAETESRWRLVEKAWELNLPRNLLTVDFDPETKMLFPYNRARRTAITPARDALNGYQKGSCFYCFDHLSLSVGDSGVAHVDHFFPHMLKQTDWGLDANLDGVWNLVLACPTCNGGAEKSASLPVLEYLERLHQRNEFLIGSNHPLRETLIAQTGQSEKDRGDFLNGLYLKARASGIGGETWKTEPRRAPVF